MTAGQRPFNVNSMNLSLTGADPTADVLSSCHSKTRNQIKFSLWHALYAFCVLNEVTHNCRIYGFHEFKKLSFGNRMAVEKVIKFGFDLIISCKKAHIK